MLHPGPSERKKGAIGEKEQLGITTALSTWLKIDRIIGHRIQRRPRHVKRLILFYASVGVVKKEDTEGACSFTDTLSQTPSFFCVGQPRDATISGKKRHNAIKVIFRRQEGEAYAAYGMTYRVRCNSNQPMSAGVKEVRLVILMKGRATRRLHYVRTAIAAKPPTITTQRCVTLFGLHQKRHHDGGHYRAHRCSRL